MYLSKFKHPVLCFCIYCAFFNVWQKGFAQTMPDSANVKRQVSKISSVYTALPPEQVYLHFDKPYYAAGDTAWVKAYVLMGQQHHASVNSAKLYMELLGSDGKMLQQLVLPVFDGLAQGFIPLDEKKIPEGSYTLRAYTNWQQNFGATAFFYRQFNVGKLGGKTWLVTEQNRNDSATDTSHVQLAMRFSDGKGLPLVAHKLSIKLLENGKAVLKSEMTTGVDGTLNGGFNLPAKVNRRVLSIAVEDAADKSQHITFPFYPSGNNGDIDLQFMPEGGSLVAGLYNKIGFKAIGEDGLGRDVKGTVVDSKGEEAAILQSLHNGMGSFVLVPQAGETYTAKILVNGKEKKYALPAAKTQGMALRVDGVSHAGELYVYISATAADSKAYTLIAQSKQMVYFGSGFSLNSEGYYNTRIPKNNFGTGIVSLTVLGPDDKPVCTRNVFINRNDALQISAVNTKSAYSPGDSVSVNLHVADADDMPVQGSFSVAVTDDAQVKDAVQADNIQSHILLTSELKGNIENPAWYFVSGTEAENQLKEKALDNLLLTQGWQGFDWGKLNAPITEPAYQPEPDNRVTGKLINLLGKPAVGLSVALMANKKQFLLLDTISDKNGLFAFKNLPLTDTAAYVVKLHNKKGGSAAAGIIVDEFKPTQQPLINLPRKMPWNINADTSLITYINGATRRNYINNQFTAPAGTTLLKEVQVKDKRITQAIGIEYATEVDVIDEAKLIAAKKMSLMELLEKELHGGFRQTYLYAMKLSGDSDGRTKMHPNAKQFAVSNLRVNDFIVDGQSMGELTLDLRSDFGPLYVNQLVTRFQRPVNDADQEYFSKTSDFLNAVGAEDVKKISVFRGSALTIVITTRSGKGLNAAPSIGTYAYRPLPMQLPRQFYSPKYTVNNKQPDLRSTIHWEPNVITDAAGNAKLTFLSADKPATYSLVVEGTDMQGHFGVSNSKINIAPGTAGVNK